MRKVFNKKNINIIKIFLVLCLVLYTTFKAIPKLKDNPSTFLILATIIASIGFFLALFKLSKEIRKESLNDKGKILVIKNTKDKLITLLNVIGTILVVFMLIVFQLNIVSKDMFVFIYAFTGIILLAIIILNILKKRGTKQTNL